jgi:DNA-binding winged helix-turn-helix (wHTH) protein/Tol biopolymer transport system component
MSLLASTQALRIGDFVLDPSLNELRRGDDTQRLPAKQVELLLRLAAEPGRMIPRETLLEAVWERRLVNDEVLSRAVADLRQVLGDDARAPRYIETVPKRGYRLVAAVAPLASTDVAATTLVASPAQTRRGWFPLAAALLLFGSLAAVFWNRLAPPSPVLAADPLTAANLLRARPFTTEAGRELFPRFTPDGRWVLYSRADSDDSAANLRLRAVDGTEDRVLAAGEGDNFCGSVSPDGTTLAWLRARPGICELVHRPMLGGPARVLAGCDIGALAGCPDWAPDGRSLLLGAGHAGPAGLREVTYPGGAERELTSPPAGSRDLLPRHSPDGIHVVFWRGDHWGRTLHRLDRRGGAASVLLEEPHLAFGHAFSADGDLVLADDRFGQRALVGLASTNGATPQLLGGVDARYPDLARDGSLVFEVARYDANLWRIDLASDPGATEPQRLTTSVRYDSQPALSNDGRWLAFGSNRDGREGVYLMRSDGSEERKLPLDPALRWTSPVWSPDDASLVLLRYTDDGATFCRFRLAQGTADCPERFGRGMHGAFFLDPEHLGAVDADPDAPTLHRLALADGTRTALGIGIVDRCRATSRWLVCHRPGKPGLRVQDRARGDVREVLVDRIAENRGAWNLTEGAIYFASAAADPAVRGLFRFDLGLGEVRRVSEHWPNAIGDTLAVAADESFLVFARTDALETDLMYVPPPLPPQP